MKPRPSAPLTETDASIWHDLACKWSGNAGFDLLWPQSLDADRRDAELMHWAQGYRVKHGRDYILQVAALGDNQQPILVCGALERFRGLDDLDDITSCA